MREGEIRALGEIAGRSVARPSAVARDVHRAVTRRVFGALGPLGIPVRALHDPVSTVSYETVAAGLRVPLAVGGRALARGASRGSASLAESRAGCVALG